MPLRLYVPQRQKKCLAPWSKAQTTEMRAGDDLWAPDKREARASTQNKLRPAEETLGWCWGVLVF